MATCLDCIIPEPDRQKQFPCFCKISTNKLSLKRSASLKDSPTKARRGSNLSMEKRSLSMSSLNRSRSVQKLDFSMDMSIDGSIHNCSQGMDRVIFFIFFNTKFYRNSSQKANFVFLSFLTI